MTCPNCGTAVDAEDRHCRECGRELVRAQASDPSGPVEAQAGAAVPPSAAPSGRKVEDIALGVVGLVVAGILWMLVLAGYPSGLTYIGLLIAAGSAAKLWSTS